MPNLKNLAALLGIKFKATKDRLDSLTQTLESLSFMLHTTGREVRAYPIAPKCEMLHL